MSDDLMLKARLEMWIPQLAVAMMTTYGISQYDALRSLYAAAFYCKLEQEVGKYQPCDVPLLWDMLRKELYGRIAPCPGGGTAVDVELDFVVYCIEEYKYREKLSGKDAFKRFEAFDVFAYIRSAYGALHTAGGPYIAEDINTYIRMRGR